jgi:hypothetical protein|uniref:hypothetical protein n=1 Tax=Clostridium butyricum TaxID=1492 RepID=UPI0018D53F32|nr:hypothetical protein [Clostridium butyricum]
MEICECCGAKSDDLRKTKNNFWVCSKECELEVLPRCECCNKTMETWIIVNGEKYCSQRCIDTEKKCRVIFKIKGGYKNYSDSAVGGAKGAENAAETMIFNTPQGHGFAAERANDLHDKIRGKKAKIVGDDYAKNGPDRLVNGENIQTKYCKTGNSCIGQCFKNGEFRYYNSDGKPMKIEVPSDLYDDAIRAMERRIKNGQVIGITDPKEAKNIVQKGSFTYEQAKNIAKFGKIESLTYDAVNGAVIAVSAFGISAILTFGTCMWNGDGLKKSTQNACLEGLKVGGITWLSTVAASQLSRTGLNSALKGTTDAVVRIMGPKTTSLITNAIRGAGSRALYGAAAKNSLSKILRGNLLTAAVSSTIFISIDVARCARGRISKKQLAKNSVVTVTGVGTGTAGWFAGAAVGAAAGSVVPIIGNVAGGLIGGLIGAVGVGTAGSMLSKKGLDYVIEDDSKEITEILCNVLNELCINFLVSEDEFKQIEKKIKEIKMAAELKKMFACANRESYATSLLKPIICDVVSKRNQLALPSEKQIIEETKDYFENLPSNIVFDGGI